jgi:hypothetical protein
VDLLPSSGKTGRRETLAAGPEAWGLTLAQPWDPAARVSVLPILLEDGRRSSLRNVTKFLLKYRRWTKSKKPLLQIKNTCFYSIVYSN